MCGRTACTRDPETLQKACCYLNKKTNKYCQPEWKEVLNGRRNYVPSYNIAPTNITPVLVNDGENGRIMQPMMWGMIPPWHKGDPKSHRLSTNNCRIENLSTSKLYKPPFIKGQRCVVICEGFYEWQTTKSKTERQPYFIYMPQNDSIKIEEEECWESDYDEKVGWKGPKLMKIAGIYNIWKSDEGDEIYGYSIITVESNETFSWLHHRMPAILDTDEAVSNWLESDRMDYTQSVTLLQPLNKLQWHPVSTLVNNSRNKDSTCNKPVTASVTSPKKQTSLQRWLKSGRETSPKKKSESDSDFSQAKKFKS